MLVKNVSVVICHYIKLMVFTLLQAGTVRDSMAKSLYSALFDWIVFRINHALLNQRDLEESAKVKSFLYKGIRRISAGC